MYDCILSIIHLKNKLNWTEINPKRAGGRVTGVPRTVSDWNKIWSIQNHILRILFRFVLPSLKFLERSKIISERWHSGSNGRMSIAGEATYRKTEVPVRTLSDSIVGAGTIFRLVKNNQDNQIQSITLCNMYFRKRYTQSTMGSGAKPQKLGNFREFLC